MMIEKPIIHLKREKKAGIFKMEKSITRLLIAGNVDDGKSTLLGRLFFESGSIKKDQLKQLIIEEKENYDFSKVSDGLIDELQLGITIDVAYKFLRQIKEIHNSRLSRTHSIYKKHVYRCFYSKRCHTPC